MRSIRNDLGSAHSYPSEDIKNDLLIDVVVLSKDNVAAKETS